MFSTSLFEVKNFWQKTEGTQCQVGLSSADKIALLLSYQKMGTLSV